MVVSMSRVERLLNELLGIYVQEVNDGLTTAKALCSGYTICSEHIAQALTTDC